MTLETTLHYLQDSRRLKRLAEHELAILLLPIAQQAHTLPAWQLIEQREAEQRKGKPIWPPVLVYYFEGDTIELSGWVSFDFFGLAGQHDFVDQLVHDYPVFLQLSALPDEPDYKDKLASRVFCGRIEPNNACHNVVDRLLNQLMHYSRPLRHYGCTFYLPVYAESALKPVSTESYTIKAKKYPTNPASTEDAQAYEYFYPPIRDFLFDTSHATLPNQLAPIREWQLAPLNAEWELGIEEAHQTLQATITDISLYQYFNQLCVLAITVKPAALQALATQSADYNWWHSLFFSASAEDEQALQLSYWLRFTKLARILFPSFTEQTDEGKIAKIKLTTPMGEFVAHKESNDLAIEAFDEKFSGHNVAGEHPIAFLMQCFFGQQAKPVYFKTGYHQFYDDRMFVNVAYGYHGAVFPEPLSEQLFALALYVDQPSDTFPAFKGYAYDSGFTAALMAQQRSTRWQANGLNYGFTQYSNAYVGQDWFFCNITAPKIIPHIYGRMLLLTLFYQASLRHYNHRLTEQTRLLVKENKNNRNIRLKAIQNLRKDFISFTNVYWFHDVTAQTQGQEIFRLQQQALELQREYAFIKEEMARLDEYLQGDFNKDLNFFLKFYYFQCVSCLYPDFYL